jgi:hypothetical protein
MQFIDRCLADRRRRWRMRLSLSFQTLKEFRIIHTLNTAL